MSGARQAMEHVNFPAMVTKVQFECYNSGEETQPDFDGSCVGNSKGD